MTGLREMFEDLADAAPAPSRLTGDDVYAAGRQRHRRQARLAAGAAALALATVAGVAGVALTGPPQTPDPGPAAAGEALPAGPVVWFGAADADHLYVTQHACASGCPKTEVRLLGSDDGGRTWTRRVSTMDATAVTVLGPRTLIASPAGDGAAPVVSTDGGRVWTPARPRAMVRTVPAGGDLICWSATGGASCVAHAVDPAGGWFAPLAQAPALAAGYTVESAAGRLWAAGTTPAGEPAVAVSANAGSSWLTRVLDCGCDSPQLATTADGRTAYAVLTKRAGKVRVGYRLGMAGDPEPLGKVGASGFEGVEPGQRAFVTADGTLVLSEVVRTSGDIDGVRFWADRDGGSWQPIELTGLPSTVYGIRRAVDGWFYTHTYGPERGLYGSPDGRQWTLITE